MPIGNPQWPELAFWTASMVSTRIALMQVWSRSDRFTLICVALAKISPRLVLGGCRVRQFVMDVAKLYRRTRATGQRRARSPIFLVVVLGVASLTTHQIHCR